MLLVSCCWLSVVVCFICLIVWKMLMVSVVNCLVCCWVGCVCRSV